MNNFENLVEQLNDAIAKLGIKSFELNAYYNRVYNDIRFRGHLMGLQLAINIDNIDTYLKVINNANVDNIAYLLTYPEPSSTLFKQYGGIDKSYHTVREGWFYRYEGQTGVISLLSGDWIGYADHNKINWVKQS